MKTWLITAGMLAASSSALAAQDAHLLVVSGLGGEPAYSNAFVEWGTSMVQAAVDRYGVDPEHIHYLAEDPSAAPGAIDGESRRDAVLAAVSRMARDAADDDRVMILLIGHGSADARGSRLNLPGPDITAEELNDALDAFDEQPIVIVNAASASGDFQEILAGPRRTIVTATKSGMERNETVFGKYFVAAYAGDEADADRNGRLTLKEAYDYAVRETERDYTNSGRLQVEHSRMEGDMELAAVFQLGTPTTAIPSDASPQVRALYEERVRLEGEIEALRARNGQMDQAEYQSQLEALLLDLARTNREIQEMEGSTR